MTTTRRFCAAIGLALTLTLTTLAGEIQTPLQYTPPPGQPAIIEVIDEHLADGEIQYGNTYAEGSDVVLEAAMSLLRIVMTLL